MSVTLHKPYEMSEKENGKLPLPRLEIRWRVGGEGRATWAIAEYNLVTRHLCDHIQVTPLGKTESRGGVSGEEKCAMLDLPFRDGAHLVHDKEQLKIPGYVVYGKNHRLVIAKTPEERE